MATQRIRGTAEKFLATGERGYAVLRVRLANGDTLRAVGALASVPLGAECDFTGQYRVHPVHGREFSVDSYTAREPTSLIGVERFLSSGHFKGIGPQTAKKLVSHFGVRTLDVLRDRPEALAEVPGLSARRARTLAASFAAHQDLARLAAFLRGHDLPLHLVEKLAQVYGGGGAALRMLQEHPYQAVEDVRGIGWKTADGIARAIGLSAHAPERIIAALMHVLVSAEEEGHTFLPFGVWTKRASSLLGLPVDEVYEGARGLTSRGVILEPAGGEPAVYTARMHRIEGNIARRLLELTDGAKVGSEVGAVAPPDGGDGAGAINDSFLTAQQAAAVQAALSAPLVVLTGGPGTGKTTAVRRMAELAEARGETVVLTAPTGRAAKRLAQSAGRSAQTVHRLLEIGRQDAAGYGFRKGRHDRLRGDLFILDEASMLDAPLFSHLLDALPDGARLLLVGDPEQLPAVGPGNVLRDVIDSGLAQVFALHLVFRQERHSEIVLAAHAVRAGQPPAFPREKDAQFFFIAREDAGEAAELVAELAAVRLPRYLGVDPRTGVQVIAPMRRGACGLDRLNELLSLRLSAPAPHLQAAGRTFRLRDKVMNVKNDYDRDIYNGDIGVVTEVADDGLTVCFDMDDDPRLLRFSRAECASLAHAYAISVHKSQGGEYPCVIFPVLREHAVMLDRQLVYTAMTRARRLLVIVGSEAALKMAAARTGAMRRYSGLPERLKQMKSM